ncbi:hypothetical protein BDY17DRAFT_323546 [Neohortaea acidophila]|uniref:Protein FAF1 n=1 Tax=Neohortaea acidophila TaxID=245834 RepID=A0A6A6PXE6_9PEZI|nr:uncharacterized protein BDY17DRAFT_323546 [Neohortaea acidophila]KAF2484712.1 hypothetical protein BDY17DRAFT_323546 [Neohortaea acidophila]
MDFCLSITRDATSSSIFEQKPNIMAVSIGKRKRKDIDDDGRGSGDEHDDAMRALFQKAFEAKFKPLERQQPVVDEDAESSDQNETPPEEDSDWSGLSYDEDDEEIETFHHDSSAIDQAQLDAHDRKSFMSSRPPTSTGQPSTSKTQTASSQQKADPTEVTNLKHDLALQRLLKESHLLDPESFQSGSSGASTPTTSGKTRLKALDLRLQDLGAKHPATQQQRMPLSHRKGIAAKAAGREQQRRKDAVENGVILEKARSAGVAGSAKGPVKRRERGIGGPTVGKFKGGTLRLSERDVRAIQGRKKGKAGGRR